MPLRTLKNRDKMDRFYLDALDGRQEQGTFWHVPDTQPACSGRRQSIEGPLGAGCTDSADKRLVCSTGGTQSPKNTAAQAGKVAPFEHRSERLLRLRLLCVGRFPWTCRVLGDLIVVAQRCRRGYVVCVKIACNVPEHLAKGNRHTCSFLREL